MASGRAVAAVAPPKKSPWSSPEVAALRLTSLVFRAAAVASVSPEAAPVPSSLAADYATDAAAQAFKADFGADDYTTLLSGWESKLAWAGAGDFKWALITAKKPS